MSQVQSGIVTLTGPYQNQIQEGKKKSLLILLLVILGEITPLKPSVEDMPSNNLFDFNMKHRTLYGLAAP